MWVCGRSLQRFDNPLDCRSSNLRMTVPQNAPVILHVYDLGTSGEVKQLNRILRALGSGAFHCGVEVYGREWGYKGNPIGLTGIFVCRPCDCENHSYSESVPMGETAMSEDSVMQLLKRLKTEWRGSDYNLLTCNCCHFSEVFCRCLGVDDIPPWLTHLADTGAAITDKLEHVQNTINREYHEISVAGCKPVKHCCAKLRSRFDKSEIVESSLRGPECDDDEDIVILNIKDKSVRRRQSALVRGPSTTWYPPTRKSFISTDGRLSIFL